MTQPTDSGLKLLPCPFCGGKAEYNRGDDHTTACCLNTNCPAFQIEATTTAWNTRPSAPADDAKLHALESQLKQAKTAIKALSNHEFFIQHFPSTAKIFAALSDNAELKETHENP